LTGALFQPLSQGKLRLPNRITVSPMCQYAATDDSANDWRCVVKRK
jgi:2,4-dienoyl-CoA reductase-like NADH-dependent reductase (Old Yellow Enzyme family)